LTIQVANNRCRLWNTSQCPFVLVDFLKDISYFRELVARGLSESIELVGLRGHQRGGEASLDDWGLVWVLVGV
jgi:hypothetical protein